MDLNKSVYSNVKVLDSYSMLDKLWDSEEYIIDTVFTKNGSVLDIGFWWWRTTINLLKKGFNVTWVEYSEVLFNDAKKNFLDFIDNERLKLIFWDILEVDFWETKFDDIFFSFNGIDYIYPKSSRLDFLQKMYMLLKPGWTLLYTTHNRYSIDYFKNYLLWFKNNREYNTKYSTRMTGYIPIKQNFWELLTYYTNLKIEKKQLEDLGFNVKIFRVDNYGEIEKRSFLPNIWFLENIKASYLFILATK